jgi:hypothetical protein
MGASGGLGTRVSRCRLVLVARDRQHLESLPVDGVLLAPVVSSLRSTARSSCRSRRDRAHCGRPSAWRVLSEFASADRDGDYRLVWGSLVHDYDENLPGFNQPVGPLRSNPFLLVDSRYPRAWSRAVELGWRRAQAARRRS